MRERYDPQASASPPRASATPPCKCHPPVQVPPPCKCHPHASATPMQVPSPCKSHPHASPTPMQISLPSSGVSFTPHCPHVCPAFFWSSGEERLGCLNWDVTKALSAPVARRALERYGAAGSAVFEPLLRLCLSRSALSRPSAAQASLITSLITPILPPHATHPIFPTHISATAQPTHTHLTHTRRFFFFDASTQSGETRRSPSSAAPRPIIAHAVPSRRRRSPDDSYSQ